MKATRDYFTDQELRVMLGAIAHARTERGEVPRLRIPTAPVRNPEPLSDADPDWLSEWREREYQEAKSSARALAIGLVFVAAVLVVVGGMWAWLLK